MFCIHQLETRMRAALDQLTFPAHVSADARSLVLALLCFDPARRLGSGPTGAAEIRAHPFFARASGGGGDDAVAFDWARMERRLLPPPFVPAQTQVNAAFIEPAQLALNKTTRASKSAGGDKTNAAIAHEAFREFAYVNPRALQAELARSVYEQSEFLHGAGASPNE
jgi:serum/glucocorticoid-regulated kinase 2